MFTNDGFGLLRVLSADITGFVVATVLILIVAFLADYVCHKIERDSFTALKAARIIRRICLWVWIAVLVGLAAHSAFVAMSLRIPRSDVNATGVYLDMNSAIEGKSKR